MGKDKEESAKGVETKPTHLQGSRKLRAPGQYAERQPVAARTCFDRLGYLQPGDSQHIRSFPPDKLARPHNVRAVAYKVANITADYTQTTHRLLSHGCPRRMRSQTTRHRLGRQTAQQSEEPHLGSRKVLKALPPSKLELKRRPNTVRRYHPSTRNAPQNTHTHTH